MLKVINYIILILSILLPSCASLASGFVFDMDMHKKLTDQVRVLDQKNSKIIEVSYRQQLSLNISDAAINRISFNSARVSKIIGNISGFTSILSDDGSNLFITPKLSDASTIDFAVLLASGDIIDMSLTVVKSKKPCLISLKFPDHSNQNVKSEVSLLIEAMKSKRLGKYYVQEASSNVTIANKDKIKATSGDIYRFGDLHGISVTLQNIGKRSRKNISDSSIEITESDLLEAFKGVVGVDIENTSLKGGEKTKAYIVFKEAA